MQREAKMISEAAEVRSDYEDRFRRINSDVLILKWMAGVAIASSLAILTRLFII